MSFEESVESVLMNVDESGTKAQRRKMVHFVLRGTMTWVEGEQDECSTWNKGVNWKGAQEHEIPLDPVLLLKMTVATHFLAINAPIFDHLYHLCSKYWKLRQNLAQLNVAY
jgi:hypothetical protein